MQTQSRLLHDLARVAGGALGALAGIRGEVEALVRQRVERLLGDMELVSREEFEAVKAMAAKARAEQEGLAGRVQALEAGRTGAGRKRAAAKTPRRKTGAAKASAKARGRGSAPRRRSAGKTKGR